MYINKLFPMQRETVLRASLHQPMLIPRLITLDTGGRVEYPCLQTDTHMVAKRPFTARC